MFPDLQFVRPHIKLFPNLQSDIDQFCDGFNEQCPSQTLALELWSPFDGFGRFLRYGLARGRTLPEEGFEGLNSLTTSSSLCFMSVAEDERSQFPASMPALAATLCSHDGFLSLWNHKAK